MTQAVEGLLEAALRLSSEEIQELAEALLRALESRDPNVPTPDWHLEVLEERVREVDQNPDSLIPADAVFDEILAKLRKDR